MERQAKSGSVVAVASSGTHTFTKPLAEAIRLVKGLGVEGDAHLGETVKHRSRVRIDPTQPNLRQVHLIHEELFDEMAQRGHALAPGLIGENITSRGIDLLGLPLGTILEIGPSAKIEVTGLRNPCKQLNEFSAGLTQDLLDKDADGLLIRKAGIMGIVAEGGEVKPGDQIAVLLPPGPHVRLEKV